MVDAARGHGHPSAFDAARASPARIRWRAVQLFHYHLVTSHAREVEARYLGKLGFDLVARHGRIGEDLTSYEPGTSWDELDAVGFKLRLSELELGAVNVVVQPGPVASAPRRPPRRRPRRRGVRARGRRRRGRRAARAGAQRAPHVRLDRGGLPARAPSAA